MWSVGVIIFVLLVGYPPFLKDSQTELFQQIRSGDWVFHERDWENISADARELIENLLVVDPEQRWTVHDALRCSWIQQPEEDLSANDLSEALRSLRQKKSRLRKMGQPVIWRGKEKIPLPADLQFHDPVREGSPMSL